jgi:hypothetical protein
MVSKRAPTTQIHRAQDIVDVLLGWLLAPALRSATTQRAIGRFLVHCDAAWSASAEIVASVADLLAKLFADVEVCVCVL